MKKNKLKFIIIFIILFIAIVSTDNPNTRVFLEFESLITIFMSIFVLLPLAEIFSKDNSEKLFWIIFAIRLGILLYCYFFVSEDIIIYDIIAFFIGIIVVVPVCSKIKRIIFGKSSSQYVRPTTLAKQVNGIELKCGKCGGILKVSDKFCSKCGAPFDGNNVVVSEKSDASVQVTSKGTVLPSNFDEMYSLSEDKMLEEFIKKELTKNKINQTSKQIPTEILKRKNILNIIFSILVFVYITLIFFHFPLYTYLIGIALLLVFYKITTNYNLINYLKKQIKARPSEKISNIIMNAKTTLISDNSKNVLIISSVVVIVLSLIIFRTPKIIYERIEGGYAVRYYILGLTNFTSVTIPDTYNNKNVVSLRGNTFSNMPFLKSVSLPETITEIRGQAFKNCYSLTKVNIPKKLKYLGGGAFYKAKSIKNIELPDTLTYLGGESFYGAKSLEHIKLSNKLTEIRGDTFKYCTSLKSITIPDNVIRIGGHAFYGDTSLSDVIISENSNLQIIGSSAFRKCSSLYFIIIPPRTSVNERAFKESPTKVSRYKDNYSTEYVPSSSAEIQEYYDSILEIPDLPRTWKNEYIINYNYYVMFDKYNIIVKASNLRDDNKTMLEVVHNGDLNRGYIEDIDYVILNKCKVEAENANSATSVKIKVQGVYELSKAFKNNKVINLNINDNYKVNDNFTLALSKIENKNDTIYYEFYSNLSYDDTSKDFKSLTLTKKEGIYIIDNIIMLEIISSNDKQVTVKIYYN